MSERWVQYVRQGIEAAGGPLPFGLAQWSYLTPVYAAIRRALPAGGRVLDVGCGGAVFSSLLAHHGYDVVGVDDDPEIVSYGRTIAEYFRSPVRVEQASAAALSDYHGRFDLAYSLGVIEHFERNVTVELLREQFACAPLVVAVIPTPNTRYAAKITDEHFYTRRAFNRLFLEAGAEVLESLVFGDVPSPLGKLARRALPPPLYRAFSQATGCTMQFCTVGRRATR